MKLAIQSTPDGVTFWVKVVPGASRDKIMGLLGDALKLAVSKPPSAGEANKGVIELLSKSLNIKRQQITILTGHTNPRKQIAIQGVTEEEVLGKLG